MSQITIRGMEPDVEREVRKLAKKSGKSLNRIILDMLYQHMGLSGKMSARPGESLKKLAGGWTENDAAEFKKSIEIFEEVDAEMWK